MDLERIATYIWPGDEAGDRLLLAQLNPAVSRSTVQQWLERQRLGLMLLYAEVAPVLRVLAPLEPKAILLKGLGLTATVYPPEVVRPQSMEIDLLLKPEQMAEATHLLEGAGFKSVLDTNYLHGAERLIQHGQLFQGGKHLRLSVDLHDQLIFTSHQRFAPSTAWFQQATEPFVLEGSPVRFLSPTANLLFLAGHLFFQHAAMPRPTWFLDIHYLIARRGSEIRWAEARTQAQAWGWEVAIAAVLASVAELCGTALPAEAAAWQRLAPNWQAHFAEAGRWSRGDEPLLSLQTLVRPTDRLRYLAASLFPPKRYLQTRYADLGLWWPLLYPYRWRLAVRAWRHRRLTNS